MLFFCFSHAAQAGAVSPQIITIIDSLRPEKRYVEGAHAAGFRTIEEMGTQKAVQELIQAAKSGDEQTVRVSNLCFGRNRAPRLTPVFRCLFPISMKILEAAQHVAKEVFFERNWWLVG